MSRDTLRADDSFWQFVFVAVKANVVNIRLEAQREKRILTAMIAVLAGGLFILALVAIPSTAPADPIPGIPGITFTTPLGWTVQTHESLLFLLSPETIARTRQPEAAHIEPDVLMERLDNPEGLALLDFALEFHDGLFATYRHREDVTIGGRPAIRFTNVGAEVDRAPVLVVFVSLNDGSILMVAIPTYEAQLMPGRLAGFEHVRGSLSFD